MSRHPPKRSFRRRTAGAATVTFALLALAEPAAAQDAAPTVEEVKTNLDILWVLLAFVASGFEHSVANVTIISLGVLSGEAGIGDVLWNLAWTVPGNIVGGGLLVALAYVWTWDAGRQTPAGLEPAVADPRDLVVSRG